MLVGGTIIAVLIIMALFAPMIATHDPDAYDYTNRFALPSGEHFLGTDTHGRDIFSRMVYGTRISLLLGFGVNFLGVFAGAICGILCGYFKKVDAILMRVMEGLHSLPTTLLAMVDASVGGKTGINFNGLKNEIGVFSPAEYVLIDTEFLKSLDSHNLLSGYAEMLKHGIISTTEHWAELLNFDLNQIDYKALQQLVAHSVSIKEDIVEKDPFEKNIRKALNLGHTVGHAFESLALENNRPVLHGYAVAWGIICELYFSFIKVGFPKDKLRQTIQFIKENYGVLTFDCKQYDRLYEFMTHDKKNSAGIINFTLMGEIGDIRINQSANKEEILEILDFYRETMGC